jgi:general secretion pathway protein G
MTLVELAVVVMILGIIAAIAVPKVVSTVGTAQDKGLAHSVAVVGDAINYFATIHAGQLPGADGTDDGLKSDLKTHIPKFPINPKRGTGSILVVSAGVPLAPVGGIYGWVYDNTTGEFIANADAPTGANVSSTP